eukprot:TRINITY_DN9326_c0_g1_i4.p1 TRINITY_DN9326_c0_g1~~TRINITY_DN9326_c0_g1_i4.p1  ORF type:complete len:295 (-),score=21.67 TRINITY_DN9326_c0_g1_i4:79-963(-)
MTDKVEQKLKPWQHVVAAGVGGAICAFAVCPLDVVKTRIQSQTHFVTAGHNQLTPHFTGVIDAFIKITRHEGIFNLWRGLTVSVLLTAPGTAIYFACYEALKKKLHVLDHWNFSVSGVLARSVTVILTSPLELVKTNVQSHNRHTGLVHIIKNASREKNYKTLWVGIMPTLLRDVPFSALYWPLYEFLKSIFTNRLRLKPDTLVHFSSGALAGSFAAAVTTPVDVIKTRVQMGVDLDSRKTHNVFKTAMTIFREEGLSGFAKGLVPRVVRVTPMCAIMISTYEFLKSLMLRSAL